jgi:RIO kinase 1
MGSAPTRWCISPTADECDAHHFGGCDLSEGAPVRKRDIERLLAGDVRDIESLYELADQADAPTAVPMRRDRDGQAPRARGRLTEQARARLAQQREDATIDDGPADGDRWSTWGDADERGPQPYPSWLLTELAAVDFELGVLKTGKEADVFLVERALPDGDRTCLMAAKRYRGGDHRLFHRDAGYLEGRRVRATREMRAIHHRSDFGRNLIAQQWAAAEFAALGELWAAGAPVPYPIQRIGTELLEEFIGDADGTAAPRLVQLRPDPHELAGLWRQLVDAMVLLARGGHSHGDLSAYNLLVHDGELVLIDLPQLVDIVANPQGPAFLERDVRTVTAWFASRGLPADLADASAVTELLLAEAGLR